MFYLQVLKNIEENYPGLKDLLLNAGLSVQSQDRYPHRTTIDMRRSIETQKTVVG